MNYSYLVNDHWSPEARDRYTLRQPRRRDDRRPAAAAPTTSPPPSRLVGTGAEFGTYNVTNGGPTQSWFDTASRIFELVGSEGPVAPISTEEYGRGKSLAPRPRHSTLDLDEITSTGFEPPDAGARLVRFLAGPPS